MALKPTLEEVVAYAQPIVGKFIAQFAAAAPQEHREEMAQTALLRLVEAYDRLDADAGWKSFVYNHCRGAVLDYLKFGVGFAENKQSLRPGEEDDGVGVPKLMHRVQAASSADENQDQVIERALSAEGIFQTLDHESPVIKWDLLARLASQDEHLHAFAKFLRGVSVEKMAPLFRGRCRTRVSQMIQVFVDRFDDGEYAECPWFMQTCYALGLSRLLGMPNEPVKWPNGNFIGYNLDPVDLDFVPPEAQDAQMGFGFDEQEEEKQEPHG